jgi:hypothetical protein
MASTGQRLGGRVEDEHDEPLTLAQALGEWAAAHHPGRTYVTQVSVPKLGEPDREREAGI